ncbi:hypothetical protein BO71DRAFT_96773 [Aspergillus ellipticus CBS 707.79]|uniref:Uncharacterized protein n=1 Tax=Aspergillus ellipticus CBS 707.79 TaxID=1448320 RepID=A0A319D5W9_9EURO|nr:hypothetical protein BO71DRAFT_96773 [Aspergillus ellipticus CBS 707.79]
MQAAADRWSPGVAQAAITAVRALFHCFCPPPMEASTLKELPDIIDSVTSRDTPDGASDCLSVLIAHRRTRDRWRNLGGCWNGVNRQRVVHLRCNSL